MEYEWNPSKDKRAEWATKFVHGLVSDNVVRVDRDNNAFVASGTCPRCEHRFVDNNHSLVPGGVILTENISAPDPGQAITFQVSCQCEDQPPHEGAPEQRGCGAYWSLVDDPNDTPDAAPCGDA